MKRWSIFGRATPAEPKPEPERTAPPRAIDWTAMFNAGRNKADERAEPDIESNDRTPRS